jgi:hypothetical protein
MSRLQSFPEIKYLVCAKDQQDKLTSEGSVPVFFSSASTQSNIIHSVSNSASFKEVLVSAASSLMLMIAVNPRHTFKLRQL